jgi:hypothetical protein
MNVINIKGIIIMNQRQGRNASNANALIQTGYRALHEAGYETEREPGIRKNSIRRVSKDGASFLASIKSTTNATTGTRGPWISFVRNEASWDTLVDVDKVVAVAVDPRSNSMKVHLLDAKDLLGRFDRTFEALTAAGRSIQPGHPLWIPLYSCAEYSDLPSFAGAGAGDASPMLREYPLNEKSDLDIKSSKVASSGESQTTSTEAKQHSAPSLSNELPNRPLSGTEPSQAIQKAKQWLADIFGVEPSNVKITIEA